MTEGNPDRVSVSLGSTVSANYNSVRVEVGMSSDLHGTETPQQGLERVQKVCAKRLEHIVAKMKGKLDS